MSDAIELDILHNSRESTSEDALGSGLGSVVTSLEDSTRDPTAASWSWLTAAVFVRDV